MLDPILEQVERDHNLLKELGLILKYCLETHIHADHITGTAKLREATDCWGIVPENAQVVCIDKLMEGGEVLEMRSVRVEAKRL